MSSFLWLPNAFPRVFVEGEPAVRLERSIYNIYADLTHVSSNVPCMLSILSHTRELLLSDLFSFWHEYSEPQKGEVLL